MHVARTKLVSCAPYSQSRKIQSKKPREENHDDFEARVWRERQHVTVGGLVFIPPMAFKNALSEAAKFASIKIPNKGKQTYTKHFVAGVMVVEPLVLDIRAEDVPGEWLYVPSDGRRGGTNRVDKCFPRIDAWTGTVEWHILDDTITKDVFAEHIEIAGNMIGIGRFRPINNGYYGRFTVEEIDWK